ncbi:unnamed protein product [Caenorhabditis auriculariae]|uniref:Uncharacterized protein n=1 Tax=Caenorhabditis auriculariae TaxID=2777116 RepID=A0A8S1H481_9PELO|nr:unnamed protein product [Caenorhabditis auriculariae]
MEVDERVAGGSPNKEKATKSSEGNGKAALATDKEERTRLQMPSSPAASSANGSRPAGVLCTLGPRGGATAPAITVVQDLFYPKFRILKI